MTVRLGEESAGPALGAEVAAMRSAGTQPRPLLRSEGGVQCARVATRRARGVAASCEVANGDAGAPGAETRVCVKVGLTVRSWRRPRFHQGIY